MSYHRGPDRCQVQLLPACVEDYVAPNAPVRFIDAFVEGLDFQGLGLMRAAPAATGRPPFHPADLLKLYLYGYLNRVRSSRRLEAEALRNLEVVWLLRGRRPDFKTIADFRKDNRGCFAPLFKQFNLLCRQLDLFGAELVAIDGCKFKALNNPHRHYTQEQLQELVGRIEAHIAEYLTTLDSQDLAAEGVAGAPSREGLQEKIAPLKDRRGRYNELLTEMTQRQQTEVSLTDPDSRGMQRVGVGYNVQVAVDAKHDLIVVNEVVQAKNDLGQLSGLAVAAKESLGVAHLRAVADAGYHETQQLQACEAAGVETYVPAPGRSSGHSPNGESVYPKDVFHYDAAQDAYRCPAGQSLPHKHTSQRRGRTLHHYYQPTACRDCPLKAACTTAAYRKIERLANEEVAERQAVRVATHPEVVAERKTVVEHVFGTFRNWGHDRFLMKGLEKVRAEFNLSALAYNLRRVFNVVALPKLLSAVKTAPARA